MTGTRVYVGLGSNIDRHANIRGGLDKLSSRFGNLLVSPVYESKAVGFESDDFFNLVAGFNSTESVDETERVLRSIEHQFGRKRNEPGYFPRTLDIDLLLFGDLVCGKRGLPRADIVNYAFVLKPLCDIVPDLIHPLTGKPIQTLWDAFSMQDQQIKVVTDF